MDCSICKASPTAFGSVGELTYTICWGCYFGAIRIMKLVNKLETEKGNAKASKTLWNASKWVVGMTKTDEVLQERLSFLRGFVDAFRNRIHSDIQIKPGNNGSPIAAHRALLAVRSRIFKNMLESDTCKAPPSETVTLPELSHEELEALLEFLYSGSLPQHKLEKHIYSLSLAAHKYEIFYLQKFCQNYMLKSLHSCNALLVLEISDICSIPILRVNTLSFIVKHVEEIVFSAAYEAFAVKNPHLGLQITRALLMDKTKKRVVF